MGNDLREMQEMGLLLFLKDRAAEAVDSSENVCHDLE
jgi:hypothetical protein